MAQLKAFQDKVGNKNATLGQYLNAQRGLTARSHGRNDPSVIQKTLKAGEKAYDPSASKSFTNRPIPGSAAQPVPSEMKPSSAQTSSAPSAASVKQQFGTYPELKRDTEKAAASSAAPSVRPQTSSSEAPPPMFPGAMKRSREDAKNSSTDVNDAARRINMFGEHPPQSSGETSSATKTSTDVSAPTPGTGRTVQVHYKTPEGKIMEHYDVQVGDNKYRIV